MNAMRKWATPVTIGAFVLMAVTGILMFFHLDTGLNKTAHEWLGWAMVAAVLAHVVVNVRAFKLYFTKPVSRAIIGAFAVLLALSFVPLGGEGGSPVAAVMQGLGKAPVEQVISLAGQDLEATLDKLRAAGIEVEAGRTVGELAGGDRGRQGDILRVIFGS